ncbi:universal stress protein [Roseivirga sp.]|uniref:universal stress protein n=1 Tax=Roseivirga sp. TaxID=1964215 RepID=UPI003B51681D
MQDLSKFQRMLVALDLSQMDVYLLKYASMVAKIFDIDTVYFVHVATSLELPGEIQEKYGDVFGPVDEALEHEINQEVEEHFEMPPNCEGKVVVSTGKITEEILKLSKVKVVDLVILGRKAELTGTGLNSKKIAKSISSSVIFVTENPPVKWEKILVSIDYSDHSKMAFEIAAAIQKRSGSMLYSNHVYKVPTGYYKSGKTYEEFAEIMLENTKKECDRFFKKLDTDGVDYEHTYALDDDPHPADKIYRTGSEIGVDLIMIGSKGRSGPASVLIGSVAEKLVEEGNDIPIMIVKMGKENMSFLDALFRL